MLHPETHTNRCLKRLTREKKSTEMTTDSHSWPCLSQHWCMLLLLIQKIKATELQHLWASSWVIHQGDESTRRELIQQTSHQQKLLEQMDCSLASWGLAPSPFHASARLARTPLDSPLARRTTSWSHGSCSMCSCWRSLQHFVQPVLVHLTPFSMKNLAEKIQKMLLLQLQVHTN